jgi:DNA repair exonuclease SbcCD ATPase subunit
MAEKNRLTEEARALRTTIQERDISLQEKERALREKELAFLREKESMLQEKQQAVEEANAAKQANDVVQNDLTFARNQLLNVKKVARKYKDQFEEKVKETDALGGELKQVKEQLAKKEQELRDASAQASTSAAVVTPALSEAMDQVSRLEGQLKDKVSHSSVSRDKSNVCQCHFLAIIRKHDSLANIDG